MDESTKRIIHMEIGDAKQTDNKSGRLERFLMERCLEGLDQHRIHLSELVTDASKTVISLLGVYSTWCVLPLSS